MDLENASPFLESHESHVDEGNSYDFGYVSLKGVLLKFNLQCEQRFPLFPANHLFPVGALARNIAKISFQSCLNREV